MRVLNTGGGPDVAQDGSVIECSGRLVPRQRFSLYLRPGEAVAQSMVQENAQVEEGAPLLQLASEALVAQLASLWEKKQAADQNADRAEVLKSKINVAEQAIRRLDAHMDQERLIREKVPEYQVAAKIEAWSEEKLTKQGELQVLRKELDLVEKRIQESARYQRFVDERMAGLEKDIERLLIKAPFSGRVVRMKSGVERMMPGEQVLELWDDRVLQVEVHVAQQQLRYMQPGSKVQVFPHFDEGFSVPGTVRSIGAIAVTTQESQFPQFPMVVDLDEEIKGVAAGMAVAVRISRKAPEAAPK